MPTVHREEGFDIIVYPNDHAPAHVHVFKGDGTIQINIGNADTAASVIEAWNMKPKDVARAVEIVGENWQALLRKWKEIHGKA